MKRYLLLRKALIAFCTSLSVIFFAYAGPTYAESVFAVVDDFDNADPSTNFVGLLTGVGNFGSGDMFADYDIYGGNPNNPLNTAHQISWYGMLGETTGPDDAFWYSYISNEQGPVIPVSDFTHLQFKVMMGRPDMPELNKWDIVGVDLQVNYPDGQVDQEGKLFRVYRAYQPIMNTEELDLVNIGLYDFCDEYNQSVRFTDNLTDNIANLRAVAIAATDPTDPYLTDADGDGVNLNLDNYGTLFIEDMGFWNKFTATKNTLMIDDFEDADFTKNNLGYNTTISGATNGGEENFAGSRRLRIDWAQNTSFVSDISNNGAQWMDLTGYTHLAFDAICSTLDDADYYEVILVVAGNVNDQDVEYSFGKALGSKRIQEEYIPLNRLRRKEPGSQFDRLLISDFLLGRVKAIKFLFGNIDSKVTQGLNPLGDNSQGMVWIDNLRAVKLESTPLYNYPPLISTIGGQDVSYDFSWYPEAHRNVYGTGALAGRPFMFNVTAGDADSNLSALTLTLPADQPIPTGDNIMWTSDASGGTATGVLSWTPQLADVGTHRLVFTAIDAKGARDIQQFDITVQNSETIPPPVADFSANPLSGNLPLEVQFTSLSSGEIVSYSWDFGDTGTSTLKDPSHTYQSTGLYTVTLTITDLVGRTATLTKTDYINVTDYGTPVASFTASPTSGLIPLTVHFTDTSSGVITSWLWKFWDVNNPQFLPDSTEQNPTLTLTEHTLIEVALTINGPGGSSSAPHQMISAEVGTIHGIVRGSVGNNTLANIEVQVWQMTYPGISYNLYSTTATDSNGSYGFDNLPSVFHHNSLQTDFYKIKIVSQQGYEAYESTPMQFYDTYQGWLNDIIQHDVNLIALPPTSDFWVDTRWQLPYPPGGSIYGIGVGKSGGLIKIQSGTVGSYYGIGTIEFYTDTHTLIRYDQNGVATTYTPNNFSRYAGILGETGWRVGMALSNQPDPVLKSKIQGVQNEIGAELNSFTNPYGKIYGKVTSSTGAPIQGATVTIKPDIYKDGAYDLTTTTDENGNYQFPRGVLRRTNCGSWVNYTAYISKEGYEDYVSPATLSLAFPVCEVEYNVVLMPPPPPPVADFVISEYSTEAPGGVAIFHNTSTGEITNYLWDFGDGTTSTDPSFQVVHIYNEVGTYTVSLTVTGPGGTDTETKTDCLTYISRVGTVSGRVYNAATDAPVKGATVTLKPWLYIDGLVDIITTTDQYGNYEITNIRKRVAPDGSGGCFASYTINVSAATYQDAVSNSFGFDYLTSDARIDVALTRNMPAEVFVDDNYYNGGRNGRHEWGYNAFDNVQDGIDAVSSGGTVHVMNGLYHENIDIDKPLTLKGYTVIFQTGYGKIEKPAEIRGVYENTATVYVHDVVVPAETSSGFMPVNIEGLTITSTDNPNPDRGIFAVAVGEINITKNVIKNNAGGIFIADIAAQFLIADNEIRDNTASHGGGIWVATVDAAHGIIRNNVITNNHIEVEGGGIYITDYEATGLLEIINNTIAYNTASVTEHGTLFGAGMQSALVDRLVLRNNIIYGNRRINVPDVYLYENMFILGQLDFTKITYNDIEGLASAEGYGTGPDYGNNIDADPMFVDITSTPKNVHLKPASPCIDAGDPADDYPLEPEPNGDIINQGAYGNTSEAERK